MSSNTRTPAKLRRHNQDDERAPRRQPRPAPRRTGTRHGQILLALREV